METLVESAWPVSGGANALELRMLGALTVTHGGAERVLPASRKLRALLVYLALAPRPVGRDQLCELLWDVPNDPRGELRWCLSKLRGLLDGPRVLTSGDTVALDLEGCAVDVLEIVAAVQAGLETHDRARLKRLAVLFTGELLAGFEIDRCPDFSAWLLAQRRRFRAYQVQLFERLAVLSSNAGDDIFAYLEKWIELAPFDPRAHGSLLAALSARGRLHECAEHMALTAQRFASEEMDFSPLREQWQRIKARPAPATQVSPAGEETVTPRRRSLAVMPFAGESKDDGFSQDIITRLAKLRGLFVIARGSVTVLAERGIAPVEAGRQLETDYVASGVLKRSGDRVMVTIELVETSTARIVWTEVIDRSRADTFHVLEEIGTEIVSAIASEIETVERNRAILKPPASLDAWEAYHRGLWHMYRFTREENEQARHFFDRAIRLDPAFSRAYAGLSFTHWQSAFQHWADRRADIALAYEAAGRGLIADDHDPTAHWAMGRALWLRGRHDESLTELKQAVNLSPSFALGHYAISFVACQSGDPMEAIGSSDYSRRLSPYDPLLFGMLGTRALAHARLGEFEAAADWAVKAAARPNAHATIHAIAALCLALAGRITEGRIVLTEIRRTLPAYGFDDFCATFQFPADAASLFRQGAKRIGLE